MIKLEPSFIASLILDKVLVFAKKAVLKFEQNSNEFEIFYQDVPYISLDIQERSPSFMNPNVAEVLVTCHEITTPNISQIHDAITELEEKTGNVKFVLVFDNSKPS